MIRRPTWVVLALFLLILLAALVWQQSQQDKAAQATPTPLAKLLIDLDGRQVQSLRLTGADGELLAIEKGLDGSWVVVEPPGNQPDTVRIEELLSGLGNLEVSAQLDTSLDLKNLGLDPARYTLNVSFEGGDPVIVYIGDKTPTQNGYYAYREGERVGVADRFGIERLIDFLASPPVESSPTPLATPLETATPAP